MELSFHIVRAAVGTEYRVLVTEIQAPYALSPATGQIKQIRRRAVQSAETRFLLGNDHSSLSPNRDNEVCVCVYGYV